MDVEILLNKLNIIHVYKKEYFKVCLHRLLKVGLDKPIVACILGENTYVIA
jgi:hypothetical protein